MKKISKFLFGWSLLACVPLAAGAAGTYYNGSYQNPQTARQGYNTTGYYSQQPQQQQGYYQNTGYAGTGTYSSAGYSRYGQAAQPQSANAQQSNTQQRTAPAAPAANTAKNGFYLDGGISRESAMWQFEMKKAGSKLHYDNVAWNVLDAKGGYVFDLGNTKAQIDAGVKYGMQSGESSMVDDDISNGGYFVTEWVDGGNNVIGSQIGHALSAGTSSGGSMLGFNFGFGLTDFFSVGKAKITPSVGYRHFSYKLETKQNFGLSMNTAQCFIGAEGEKQCDPAIIIHYADGTKQILWREKSDDKLEVVGTPQTVDAGDTYYFQQPGTSHSYDVSWSGPYAALDMVYAADQNNSVDARVELGFPGYTATGNQPYRFDWQHPKSVEDTAGMFSAFHLGLGANWRTAMTDTVMLSVGLTYDYYTVDGADASTYLSESYHDGIYNALLKQWQEKGKQESDMIDPNSGDPVALNIINLKKECPGWVCKSDSEIKSFYKSMGIRVGLTAKF
ncbi:MAG: hypothetical protein LBJ73_01740 [Rickettsiales bacterium]|jgi:hypothetical protein|nr:hypothetical protein [Rickettsiales bacterium]